MTFFPPVLRHAALAASLLLALPAWAAPATIGSIASCTLATAANGYRGNCPYLYDVLKGDAAFRTLFRNTLRRYGVPQLAGPDSPMHSLMIGKRRYVTGDRCEAHNCAAHRYVFIHAPGSRRLSGLYQPDGGNAVWFGQPDADEQAALQQLFGE